MMLVEVDDAGLVDLGPDCWAVPEGWDEQPPTPAEDPLLASLVLLRSPAESADAELIHGMVAAQRVISAMTAELMARASELFTRRVEPARRRREAARAAGDGQAFRVASSDADLADAAVCDEVAVELAWSRGRAERLVHAGNLLGSALVRTLDALARGELEPVKAMAIADELGAVAPDVAQAVEGMVLPGARSRTVPGLREAVKDAILRAAPEVAAAKAESARERRAVRFGPAPGDPDMSELWALLPGADAARLEAALTAGAHAAQGAAGSGDDRTMDQRRIDVMVDSVLTGVYGPRPDAEPAAEPAVGTAAEPAAEPGSESDVGTAAGTVAESAGEPEQAGRSRIAARSGTAARPGSARPRTEIIVTVPLEVLTGASHAPGYLSRYGPITADLARQLAWQTAQDGTWRCAVVDDGHGTLLGLGRSTFTPAYRPPDALVRHVITRDRYCSFVGCRQPAGRCEIDHRTPWPAGPTCECNTDADCSHHHHVKHRTGFRVRPSDDPDHPPGTRIWTTPTGRDHPSFPAVLRRPDHRPPGPEIAAGKTGQVAPASSGDRSDLPS